TPFSCSCTGVKTCSAETAALMGHSVGTSDFLEPRGSKFFDLESADSSPLQFCHPIFQYRQGSKIPISRSVLPLLCSGTGPVLLASPNALPAQVWNINLGTL